MILNIDTIDEEIILIQIQLKDRIKFIEKLQEGLLRQQVKVRSNLGEVTIVIKDRKRADQRSEVDVRDPGIIELTLPLVLVESLISSVREMLTVWTEYPLDFSLEANSGFGKHQLIILPDSVKDIVFETIDESGEVSP